MIYILHGSVAFEFGQVLSAHTTIEGAKRALNAYVDTDEEKFDTIDVVACQLDGRGEPEIVWSKNADGEGLPCARA